MRMRQAVTETRLRGVNALCLTGNRQAANHPPGVCGSRRHALPVWPELLPTMLLDRMTGPMQSSSPLGAKGGAGLRTPMNP
jgi:hypothetical protein